MYWQRFKSPEERFKEKFVKIKSGCWEWTASKDSGGYGVMFYKGRNRKAHAISKNIFSGVRINANRATGKKQWDHLCRNRGCVNPDHLELVTRKINVLRGTSPASKNSKKTHCPSGHDLSKHSIPGRLKSMGVRSCYICHKERRKKYHEKYGRS